MTARVNGAVVGAVALAIVLGAATAAVAVKIHDERPRAEAGQVLVDPFSDDPLGDRVDVRVPWAHFTVAAGDPRDELPDLLGDDANVRAPEDGSFVPVDIDFPKDYGIPLAATAVPFTGRTSAVLRADGTDYDLTGFGGFRLDPNDSRSARGGRVYVAVDGHPGDLELRVTTDGVTQIVDLDAGTVNVGRATGLAGAPTSEELADVPERGCGRPVLTGRSVEPYPGPPARCRVELVLRTPYVDGLGWADEGREFLVVHASAPYGPSLQGTGPDHPYVSAKDPELSFLLDGDEPVASVPVNDLSTGVLSVSAPFDPIQAVFEVGKGVPGGTLEIRQTSRTEFRAAGGPTGRAVLTWRVDLGDR